MPEQLEATESARRLRRWNRAFDPVVVVAAIVPLGPLAAGEDPATGPGVVVALLSWLVFVVDFGVRSWLDRTFVRSWKGRTYLVIVIVTFPVYALVPGLEESDLLVISRLGWVAVLAIGGIESIRDAHLLVRRVGFAGLYAATAVFVAALVVKRVEEPEDGFETFGDSLWWAIATITTVGYGDRVPVTPAGRIIGGMLMVVGLAFLGVIAASLAAHFGLTDTESSGGEDGSRGERDEALLAEVRALRAEVARVTDRLDSPDAGSAPGADESA